MGNKSSSNQQSPPSAPPPVVQQPAASPPMMEERIDNEPAGSAEYSPGPQYSSVGGGGENGKSDTGVAGFFNYVFNFDNANKSAILNMMQYTSLSILPILLLLKGIKHLIPEDDDSKGSIEIAAESVGQLLFIMLAIWFINKIIFYIPTYSGITYKGFNETTFILPFVLILATMQTKLGAKFQILIDRVMNKWHGREGYADSDQSQDGGQQQGMGGQMQMQMQGQMQGQGQGLPQAMSPSAGLLPANRQYTQMPQMPQSTKQVQYQGPVQQGQQQQQQQQMNMGGGGSEPMAANELGGSWGSSSF